jgi:DNA-directed RNA polymerase subunit M/transcription elongation factor TFIIS
LYIYIELKIQLIFKMEIITLYETKYPAELMPLKTRLESEGIECFVADELSSQVLGYINAVDARLQIKEEDYEKARAIMETAGYFDAPTAIICPKCNSAEISEITSKSILFSFFLGLITLNRGGNESIKRYKCLKCGYKFKT